MIVEIGELLSDRVDVCHGFSVGGSGKSRARHHLAAAAALRMIRFSDRDVPLELEYSSFFKIPLNAPQIIRTMSLVIFQMFLRMRQQHHQPVLQ